MKLKNTKYQTGFSRSLTLFGVEACSQLDQLGRVRRIVMGLFALVSGLFAAAAGLSLMILPGFAGWVWQVVADIFLFLSAFFVVVAARFWLGKRRWVDRVLSEMVPKAYFYLVGGLSILFAVVIVMLIWKAMQGH